MIRLLVLAMDEVVRFEDGITSISQRSGAAEGFREHMFMSTGAGPAVIIVKQCADKVAIRDVIEESWI